MISFSVFSNIKIFFFFFFDFFLTETGIGYQQMLNINMYYILLTLSLHILYSFTMLNIHVLWLVVITCAFYTSLILRNSKETVYTSYQRPQTAGSDMIIHFCISNYSL